MKTEKKKKLEKKKRKTANIEKAKLKKKSILEKKPATSDECLNMLGVLVIVAFYIESAIKKAIIDIMPLGKFDEIKREERYRYKSLGILLKDLSKRDIDVDLLNKAEAWTKKRNKIIHHFFEVTQATGAGLKTEKERTILRKILYKLLEEGADILKPLAGLMIKYNEKMTGFVQLPPKMTDFFKEVYTIEYKEAFEKFGLKSFGFEE